MSESVRGACGLLESELWLPREREPRAAAVMCHPHPLHGGTMASSPCFRSARGMQAAGLAILRFNFRGVGRSEGTHDGEGGEEEDVRAALDWLEDRFPSLPLWAGGYSFGARTVLGLACRDARIRELLLVALPVLSLDCSALERVRIPGAVIQAARDEFGNRADLERRHPDRYPGLKLEEIADSDHFFQGHTLALQSRVEEITRRLLERRT